MNLPIEKYIEQQEKLPKEGRHLVGQKKNNCITVYQAYKPAIANYASQHQRFGGSHFSFERMTWIKPNFMWMMYRCGWATKSHQERVLAIDLKWEGFLEILKKAVHSSFHPAFYETREDWKLALDQSEVRLQWDPDHDPAGEKLTRKAIQLGLKGTLG